MPGTPNLNKMNNRNRKNEPRVSFPPSGSGEQELSLVPYMPTTLQPHNQGAGMQMVPSMHHGVLHLGVGNHRIPSEWIQGGHILPVGHPLYNRFAKNEMAYGGFVKVMKPGNIPGHPGGVLVPHQLVHNVFPHPGQSTHLAPGNGSMEPSGSLYNRRAAEKRRQYEQARRSQEIGAYNHYISRKSEQSNHTQEESNLHRREAEQYRENMQDASPLTRWYYSMMAKRRASYAKQLARRSRRRRSKATRLEIERNRALLRHRKEDWSRQYGASQSPGIRGPVRSLKATASMFNPFS